MESPQRRAQARASERREGASHCPSLSGDRLGPEGLGPEQLGPEGLGPERRVPLSECGAFGGVRGLHGAHDPARRKLGGARSPAAGGGTLPSRPRHGRVLRKRDATDTLEVIFSDG